MDTVSLRKLAAASSITRVTSEYGRQTGFVLGITGGGLYTLHTVGAPRRSPTQRKTARDKRKRTKAVNPAMPRALAPAPVEKKSWTRDQKLALAGVLLAVVGIGIAFVGTVTGVLTPEIRTKTGLDHDPAPAHVQPAPSPVPPSKSGTTTNDPQPKNSTADARPAPRKTKKTSFQHKPQQTDTRRYSLPPA